VRVGDNTSLPEQHFLLKSNKKVTISLRSVRRYVFFEYIVWKHYLSITIIVGQDKAHERREVHYVIIMSHRIYFVIIGNYPFLFESY